MLLCPVFFCRTQRAKANTPQVLSNTFYSNDFLLGLAFLQSRMRMFTWKDWGHENFMFWNRDTKHILRCHLCHRVSYSDVFWSLKAYDSADGEDFRNCSKILNRWTINTLFFRIATHCNSLHSFVASIIFCRLYHDLRRPVNVLVSFSSSQMNLIATWRPQRNRKLGWPGKDRSIDRLLVGSAS